MTDDNANNTYDLYVSTNILDNKYPYFVKYGIEVNSIFTICEQDLIPSKLLTYLRIQHATSQEMTDDNDFTKKINNLNESTVLGFLKQSLTDVLKDYRYNIVDLENMKKTISNEKTLNAINECIGEQKLLHQTIDRINELLVNLRNH